MAATTTSAYAVNSARFAQETVDGEVIVIDMNEGNYFSLRGSAATIWTLLSQGVSLDDTIRAIVQASSTADSEIRPAVTAFVSQLVNEQILVEGAGDGPTKTPERSDQPLEFVTPALEKFTEMQDLLTLDPIHEVDETGWPNRAKSDDDDD